MRKYISQLVDQQLVRKVASKSASKYTVFTWVKEHFLDFSSQQIDRKLAGYLTANPPQTKKQKIEIETTTGDLLDPTICPKSKPELVVVFSEMESLNPLVKKMLTKLPPEEQQEILSLLKSSAQKRPITNPSGWVRKCIEGGWHHQQHEPMLDHSTASPIAENKRLAALASQNIPPSSSFQLILRKDFIDLPTGQLFYHEDATTFRQQLEKTFQSAGFDFPERCDKRL